MNGFERLKEQVKDQEDESLQKVVNFLLTRTDKEQCYMQDNKTLDKMCDFIGEKAKKHKHNKLNWIDDNIVFSWAVLYFALPDELLGIKNKKSNKKTTNNNEDNKTQTPNNVVSMEEAKKKMKEKSKQLSLFGGGTNE